MVPLDDEDIALMPYRPCVGIMLVNAQGKVWLGRRVPKWEKDGGENLWQMPQGGIDKGEEPREAAFREMKEEIGTDRASILAETEGWLTYDLPREAIGQALHGKFRGQKQKWFLMRYEGCDDEFHLEPDDHEVEFDAWDWVEIDRLPDLVVPFKRKVYEELVTAFRPVVAELAAGRAAS
ncbi:RNA pyrophosphohydrolase [Kaustia mangrovi]|uniref:RNA pyrophosphohydrolase n=1 Tax=Kaustia mangrovi TaxID=2593653 RepID=A0A7S8C585_9HYPH|nr:RNA pyrophosphohydrolase [Kaustia mangrovi]QPC43643.1 RNA pyrophosphohydrolase [Kaustia mangrovi]